MLANREYHPLKCRECVMHIYKTLYGGRYGNEVWWAYHSQAQFRRIVVDAIYNLRTGYRALP